MAIYIRYQSTRTCIFYLTRAINASRALIYKYCAFYIYGAHNSTLDCMQAQTVLHFSASFLNSIKFHVNKLPYFLDLKSTTLLSDARGDISSRCKRNERGKYYNKIIITLHCGTKHIM